MRHYDPGTGRFLSQDTNSGNAYEPWTQHLYSYTSNNPVNFVDPTGHAWIVDSNSRGEIQTIASAAKPTKKISYRKPKQTKTVEPEVKRYAGTVQSNKSTTNNVNITVMTSPGNLTGMSAEITGTFAEAGKELGPNMIKSTTRPNNIGIGTWNKYINAESAAVATKYAKIAKYAKAVSYGAIGINVGFGIYSNIQSGNPTDRIISDAVVDTTIGLGGLALSAGIGAAVGSVVPVAGTAVGAVVGFGVGMIYMGVTEMYQFNGKSAEERIKDSVYNYVSS